MEFAKIICVFYIDTRRLRRIYNKKGDKKIMNQEKTTLLFTGDSITAWDTDPAKGENERFVCIVKTLLLCADSTRDIKVINTGVSGDTTRLLSARWQKDVLDHSPDYLSIMIGVNDVWRKFDTYGHPEEAVPIEEYTEIYDRLLKKTVSKVKKIFLITPFLLEKDKNEQMCAILQGYIDAVKALALKYGTELIDMQAVFDKFMFEYGIAPEYISGDRVHPGTMGCVLLAKEFLNAFGFDFGLLN